MVVSHPLLGVQLIDSPFKYFLGFGGLFGEKCLLDPDRQRQIGLPREDIFVGAVQCHGRSSTPTLHIDHRDAFRKQSLPHQWREADLTTNIALPKGAHAAVAKPGLFNAVSAGKSGIGQYVQIGLPSQILEASIGLLAKRSARYANQINIVHVSFPLDQAFAMPGKLAAATVRA